MVNQWSASFRDFLLMGRFCRFVIEVLTEQLGKKGDEGHGHVVEIENIPGGDCCRSW